MEIIYFKSEKCLTKWIKLCVMFFYLLGFHLKMFFLIELYLFRKEGWKIKIQISRVIVQNRKHWSCWKTGIWNFSFVFRGALNVHVIHVILIYKKLHIFSARYFKYNYSYHWIFPNGNWWMCTNSFRLGVGVSFLPIQDQYFQVSRWMPYLKILQLLPKQLIDYDERK